MIADKGCIDSIIRKEIQRANSSEDMFLQQGLAGISLFPYRQVRSATIPPSSFVLGA